MLDVIVRLEEPLARGDDVRAATRAGAGGQAANVAAWAASLGARARCIAKRGDDAAGELVARELAARGVELVGPVGEGATGVVVSLVEEGERSLASDRGVAPSLTPGELDAAWLDCDVLHLSGYALLREPIDAARAARGPARAGGRRARLGRRRRLDGDPPLRTGAVPRAARRARAGRPLRDRGGVGAAGWRVPRRADRRAQAGRARLHGDDRGRRLDLAPVDDGEVVDPTGAGDALARPGSCSAARSRRRRGAASRRRRAAWRE